MSGTRTAPTAEEWIAHLRALAPADPHPLGSVGHIDAAARLRGQRAIRDGDSISLAHPIAADFDDGRGYRLEPAVRQEGPVVTYTDQLQVGCHGIHHTHIDALCHVGVDGSFYGGVDQQQATERLSSELWGSEGIATRAVLLDLPELLGVDWVDVDRPVTGDDLDAALARAGTTLTPGDGVILYMGRDRFEAAGGSYKTTAAARDGGRPGLGRSGADWLVEQQVSVLAWDFLDACNHDDPDYCIHLLIWAIGLALVDNCRLQEARAALAERQVREGMLVVGPLRLEGSTGTLVNPLLLV